MGDTKPRRSNKADLKLLTQSWGPPSDPTLNRSQSGDLRASKDNNLKTSKDHVDLRAARKDVPAIVSPAAPVRGSSIGSLTQSNGSFSMLHRITGLSNINDYEKMKQIGEGTYGQVYMAKHKSSGRFVAVKRASWVTREGVPITTIREVKILKALQHPNVVQLWDIASSNNNVYLIFEFLDADFLRLLRNHIIHNMPEGQVKGLGLQLLQGVAFLHDKKIMHRDIKASNLLVSKDGTLKIADFGLARELSDHYAQYTNRVVTLWYRSPELLLGTTVYGPAIDMWSFGCLYAEFLILQPLAPGKTEIEEMELIVRLVGYPTEESMPNWHQLPYAKVFLKNDPVPLIRPTLPERLRICTRSAAGLITNLLSLNPAARMSAKDALAHPYFASDAPMPYIAPIDLTDRRDAERQRRELEREKEKEREREREREREKERQREEKAREKQRELMARRRIEMQALPSWPPADTSAPSQQGSSTSQQQQVPLILPAPSQASASRPSLMATFMSFPPSATAATANMLPLLSVHNSGNNNSSIFTDSSSSRTVSADLTSTGRESMASSGASTSAIAPAQVSWLPQLTPAMLPTSVLSSPSSNEDEEEVLSDEVQAVKPPIATGTGKKKKKTVRLSNGLTIGNATLDAPPMPMPPAAASPKLSPLSHCDSPGSPSISPSRLREDPTAFHTLGSDEGCDDSVSASAHETTFHCDPLPDTPPAAGVAPQSSEAFTHYYRQYYRRYMRKYARQHQHRRKKSG